MREWPANRAYEGAVQRLENDDFEGAVRLFGDAIQLRAGTGDRPGPDDKVVVHYTGWTTDGKTIDSSVLRGDPVTLPLKVVIKGWTEGLQQMRVGEQRRFWIPGALAYGDAPSAGKPTGMLVFDVELIGISK